MSLYISGKIKTKAEKKMKKSSVKLTEDTIGTADVAIKECVVDVSDAECMMSPSLERYSIVLL